VLRIPRSLFLRCCMAFPNAAEACAIFSQRESINRTADLQCARILDAQEREPQADTFLLGIPLPKAALQLMNPNDPPPRAGRWLGLHDRRAEARRGFQPPSAWTLVPG